MIGRLLCLWELTPFDPRGARLAWRLLLKKEIPRASLLHLLNT